MANEPTVGDTMKKCGREFLTHIGAAALEPWLEHAAKNVAHVYATGCVAIDAGILPWQPENLLRAVSSCFEEAVANIRKSADVEASARALLRERLASSPIVEKRQGAKFGPKTISAFFEMVDGKAVVTVHAKAFREWFGSRMEAAAALNWLFVKGHLRMGEKKATPSSLVVEWAERTPRWPDGTVQKSVVFKDPFGVVRSRHLGKQKKDAVK